MAEQGSLPPLDLDRTLVTLMVPTAPRATSPSDPDAQEGTERAYSFTEPTHISMTVQLRQIADAIRQERDTKVVTDSRVHSIQLRVTAGISTAEDQTLRSELRELANELHELAKERLEGIRERCPDVAFDLRSSLEAFN